MFGSMVNGRAYWQDTQARTSRDPLLPSKLKSRQQRWRLNSQIRYQKKYSSNLIKGVKQKLNRKFKIQRFEVQNSSKFHNLNIPNKKLEIPKQIKIETN